MVCRGGREFVPGWLRMQRCGGHSRNPFALLQLLQGGSKLRGCDGWRTLWGWTIDVERPAISGIGRPCGAFLDHHAHHPQSAGVGGEGLQQLLLRPDCLWRQQTRQVKVNGSEVCVSWVCVFLLWVCRSCALFSCWHRILTIAHPKVFASCFCTCFSFKGVVVGISLV